VKLPLYAEAGIPVVWIFNVQSREIEVYENPNFDRYGQKMVFSESDTLSFAPLNLTFVVKDLLP
jgi:Uma2 family endonuclease